MLENSELRERIRRRAEEIYVESGKIPGRDLENWSQAEAEILRERSTHRRAIVVDVNGTEFVGEYTPGGSGGYQPGEFSAGEKLFVRFEGEKMFVKRPDGSELETSRRHLT